jgi:hypothetical protein
VFNEHAHSTLFGVFPEHRGMSAVDFQSAMPDEYKTLAIMLFAQTDENMNPVEWFNYKLD